MKSSPITFFLNDTFALDSVIFKILHVSKSGENRKSWKLRSVAFNAPPKRNRPLNVEISFKKLRKKSKKTAAEDTKVKHIC